MIHHLNDQIGPPNIDDHTAYTEASTISDHDHLARSDSPHDYGVPAFIASERQLSAHHWQRIGEMV